MKTWHPQVLVKVNAEVDQEIAPLVVAMNEIDGLITLDSCQESPDDGRAKVYFTCTQNWQELGAILQEMSSVLGQLNLCCRLQLRLEWNGSNDQPCAHLIVDREHLAAVASVLLSSAARLNSRRSQLADGSADRAPCS